MADNVLLGVSLVPEHSGGDFTICGQKLLRRLVELEKSDGILVFFHTRLWGPFTFCFDELTVFIFV